MATSLQNEQAVDAFLKNIELLRVKRRQCVTQILSALGRANLALVEATNSIALLLAEFNRSSGGKSKTQFKAQWESRPPNGGPIGPGGPSFFCYTKTASGKNRAKRRTSFRYRELEKVSGPEQASENKETIQRIKKAGALRHKFIVGLNDIIKLLFTAVEQEKSTANLQQNGVTKIQSYVDGIPAVFNMVEFSLRRLQEEIEQIDEKIDEIIMNANSLGRTRNGAIRLSWQSLNEKHTKNRVTGPPGPYWFTIYMPPGTSDRMMYRIKKLTIQIIKKTYSGRHTKELLKLNKQMLSLKGRRQELNAVLVNFHRVVNSKYFKTFIEENIK